MDEKRCTVQRQIRNAGYAKLNTGNEQQYNDYRVDPVPQSYKEGMEIDSSHCFFVMDRNAPCTTTHNSATGRRTVPNRSIQPNANARSGEGMPGFDAP